MKKSSKITKRLLVDLLATPMFTSTFTASTTAFAEEPTGELVCTEETTDDAADKSNENSEEPEMTVDFDDPGGGTLEEPVAPTGVSEEAGGPADLLEEPPRWNRPRVPFQGGTRNRPLFHHHHFGGDFLSKKCYNKLTRYHKTVFTKSARCLTPGSLNDIKFL